MQYKNVEDSLTVMTEIVLQSHVNGTGRLFGGQLMSWMDIAGAICAKRHANFDVVTVAADKMEFFRPAKPNDVVVIRARMHSVGNTSMKVAITVEIENFGAEKKPVQLTCSAVFTYVAIDAKGNKSSVPKLEVG